jgi:hypothetical protein
MWLMVGPVAPLPGPIMRQYQGLRDEGDGHPLEAISGSVPRCCGHLERIAALGRWSDAGILFVDTARPTVGAEIGRAAAWDTGRWAVKIPWATNLRRLVAKAVCTACQSPEEVALGDECVG